MTQHKFRRPGGFYILIFFWLLLTSLFLIIIFYFNWNKEQLETQQELFKASNSISHAVDNFINDIQNSVYSIPILSSNFNECTSEVRTSLQNAVFNNPLISALAIKNKENKILCASLSDITTAEGLNPTAQGLLGPVRATKEDKPAYIIQQPLGNFILDVYILKQVLDQILETRSPYAEMVVLYNNQSNKAVLQIERNKQSRHWQASPESHYLSMNEISNYAYFYIAAVDSLKHIQIVLIAEPKIIRQLTLWHKLVTFLAVVLVSGLVYLSLRRFLNHFFSLHRAIVNAVKHERFFPVFQPVYDLNKNRYIGVEVLTRWRTEHDEVIMPDAFVNDAERTGLIVPISLQIIEKAFKECRHLLANHRDFYLGFNLSAAHFSHHDFFHRFEELCLTFQVKPSQILLEITERELISHGEPAITKKMKQLRSEGYSLAIDDFGTGHASISYLRHFPFNYLKIDKLFITAIGTGAVTEVLSHSIIQLARNLKLEIIAEGVESEKQVEYLKEKGVHLIQGWYFAKAMPIYELMPFMNGVKHE
ncbi:EAL domain-containing protein [Legionella impletisoli]|uniref:Diguanylate phosphodiesterase n=1 Tax=Legionella impletisoli TaxID=343510 RepID=A0A917JQG5_9GAMM|nr:EAL domain-containing protein [Legionella impletisoli]GGI81371.1 diguanylate phosphodiesterase [Legionella impletisoli]